MTIPNASPAATAETLILTPRDGVPITALRYLARGPVRGHLVVAGGTGVPQLFYKAFAEFASAQGYSTLTLDYRGIGLSRSAPLKGFRMAYLDWAHQDLAAAVDLPVIVYNNPGTTHFTFSLDLYARIAQLPNVASIKIPGVPADAAAHVAKIRAVIPSRVTIGVSGDASAAAGLNAGCDAWYSVIAGTIPAAALAISRPALAGDAAAATEESARLQPLWDLFAEFGGSFRVVATIAEVLGLVKPDSMPRPLLPLRAAARDRVARVVAELGLS